MLADESQETGGLRRGRGRATTAEHDDGAGGGPQHRDPRSATQRTDHAPRPSGRALDVAPRPPPTGRGQRAAARPPVRRAAHQRSARVRHAGGAQPVARGGRGRPTPAAEQRACGVAGRRRRPPRRPVRRRPAPPGATWSRGGGGVPHRPRGQGGPPGRQRGPGGGRRPEPRTLLPAVDAAREARRGGQREAAERGVRPVRWRRRRRRAPRGRRCVRRLDHAGGRRVGPAWPPRLALARRSVAGLSARAAAR